MNSKRQCDLFGHTASYINTSLQRLAIDMAVFILLGVFRRGNNPLVLPGEERRLER